MILTNTQPDLKLELKITCDKAQIKGYVVTGNLSCTSVNKTYCKLDYKPAQDLVTTDLTCGETISNSFKQITNVILIQNTGTSSATFTAKIAPTNSPKKSNIGIIIGASVGGVVVIIFAVYCIRKNMIKKKFDRESRLIE